MKLQFDGHGHLTPYSVIECEWPEFKRCFGFNSHRQGIIESYRVFLEYLGQTGITKHTQWIDGSFVTRKIWPDDLDVVAFVPSDQLIPNREKLVDMQKLFPEIDSYFVEVRFPEDPRFSFYESDRLEWLHFFLTDRHHRKKGFVQLTF